MRNVSSVARGAGAGEVVGVEPVRDHDDGLVGELREALARAGAPPRACSSRSPTAVPSSATHARELAPPVQRASDRPSSRRAPRGRRGRRPTACPSVREQLAPRRRPIVRLHPGVDQVDVAGGPRRRVDAASIHHRAQRGRRTSQRSAPAAPARLPRARRLAGQAQNLDTRAGSSPSACSSSGAHRSAFAPPPVTTTDRSRVVAGTRAILRGAARRRRRSAGSGTRGRGRAAYGSAGRESAERVAATETIIEAGRLPPPVQGADQRCHDPSVPDSRVPSARRRPRIVVDRLLLALAQVRRLRVRLTSCHGPKRRSSRH